MTTALRRIMHMRDVVKATGESRSTLYKRIAEGELSKPVKLGVKLSGWPEDEIAAYNAARIAKRDAGGSQ
jgi:prophage regulatory protein